MTPEPEAFLGAFGAALRPQFPLLSVPVQGNPMAYWDSAISTPIHRDAIAAWVEFCERIGVPADVSVHDPGAQASDAVSQTRKAVARFIGARESEVVFTKNATEALRTVSFGLQLPKDAKVVVAEGEHYANLLNWMGQRQPVPVLVRNRPEDGQVDLDHLRSVMQGKIGLVCLGLVNHITGTLLPVEEIISLARSCGALVMLDACQAVGRMPIDVTKLDCDFLVFSSVHVYAPPGVGILWGKREGLEQLNFRLGSGAVRRVDAGGRFVIPADLPQRCESGTKNAPTIAALGRSLEFLSRLDMKQVAAHDRWIGGQLLNMVSKLSGVRLLGPQDPSQRVGLASFTVEEGYRMMTCERLSAALSDTHGIVCSGGTLDGAPLLGRMQCADAVRLSGGVYTHELDLERTAHALSELFPPL